MRTTIGKLLVNDALPEDLRDYSRQWDKRGAKKVLQQVAERYPEKYREIAAKLMDIGQEVSQNSGTSISLKDLKTTQVKKDLIGKLRLVVDGIANDDRLSQKQKDEKILQATAKVQEVMADAVMAEGKAGGDRITELALSGARGSASNVNQLRGAGLMVTDNKGRVIPVPVMHNYSEGLDPVELWANTYGVRSGYIALKAATPKAGFFGKQLANAAHKLTVSNAKPLAGTGLPVNTDDPDNEGAYLADDYGPHKAGTVITPKLIKVLRRKHKRILIHSPIASISTGAGIPRMAAGVRETGRLAEPGENIGITAALAVSEPLAQSSISAKHTAGVVGAAGGGSSAATQAGFDVVERMANIPKHAAGRAPVAAADGTVSRIEDAPQGGKYVYIGKERLYAGPGLTPTVKAGTRVEAGDVLTDGLPNPAEVVQHKGVGEGRRYFLEKLHETFNNSGIGVTRRNTEILTRALVKHIRLKTDDNKGGLPGDIVEYDDFAAKYSPRKGAQSYGLRELKGKYLEQPVLHYSIGTRVTPSVINTLKEFGVPEVMGHTDEPNFEPAMQRMTDHLPKDKDWMVSLNGTHLQKNLLESVHRGSTSERHGDSYIPAVAQGIEFAQKPGRAY